MLPPPSPPPYTTPPDIQFCSILQYIASVGGFLVLSGFTNITYSVTSAVRRLTVISSAAWYAEERRGERHTYIYLCYCDTVLLCTMCVRVCCVCCVCSVCVVYVLCVCCVCDITILNQCIGTPYSSSLLSHVSRYFHNSVNIQNWVGIFLTTIGVGMYSFTTKGKGQVSVVADSVHHRSGEGLPV
jgi:hypothetical protein